MHKPHEEPDDACHSGRIDCHPQAEVEQRARKEEYCGEMVQHHAMIVGPAACAGLAVSDRREAPREQTYN